MSWKRENEISEGVGRRESSLFSWILVESLSRAPGLEIVFLSDVVAVEKIEE